MDGWLLLKVIRHAKINWFLPKVSLDIWNCGIFSAGEERGERITECHSNKGCRGETTTWNFTGSEWWRCHQGVITKKISRCGGWPKACHWEERYQPGRKEGMWKLGCISYLRPNASLSLIGRDVSSHYLCNHLLYCFHIGTVTTPRRHSDSY